MHHSSLIAMLVAGIGLAFVFGALAHKLRVSPLVGYLLAGVVVGPFTPGFVADQEMANQLAEIGIILLMFGVGLHFSLKDLLSVWTIAVPGAMVQILVATALGTGLGLLFGWNWGQGLVFGLSLSVASTVVALRTLQERRMVESLRGRITVGWLVVEDMVMVLVLVLIPAFSRLIARAPADLGASDPSGISTTILLTLGKVTAFVALMLLVGQRVIPWILHWVAHTGSRELFRLSVLAVALGVALGASTLFGVSFALGAFFAGMVLSESPLSQRAAEEILPLRDAFAVLFFVSVGMLFNPTVIIHEPLALLATLVIVLGGNPFVAYLVVRATGRSRETALAIAASLAQIGEFSFILAGIGVAQAILPPMGRDLVLAAAILSILVNPVLLALVDRMAAKPASPAATDEVSAEALPDLQPTALTGHSVLVGYGRVGSLVGAGLKDRGEPFLVIEDRQVPADAARRDGVEVLFGNAADPKVLAAANLAEAHRMFVAIPQSFEAGQAVEQARRSNPQLEIVARAHTDADVDHLARCGATRTIMGEREIAGSMLDFVGSSGDEVASVLP